MGNYSYLKIEYNLTVLRHVAKFKGSGNYKSYPVIKTGLTCSNAHFATCRKNLKSYRAVKRL